MSFFRGPNIVKDSLVFYFDALNKKCYQGIGDFTDLINKGIGIPTLSNDATLTLESNHLLFNNAGVNGSNKIIFPPDQVVLPKSKTATFAWYQHFIDGGDVSYYNFSSNYSFGFRTGWGTDGPRWKLNGIEYYLVPEGAPRYAMNIWQYWVVVFDGNRQVLETYLDGQLVNIKSVPDSELDSRDSSLQIGSWNGYMDIIKIYNRGLTSQEILQNYNATKSRFGL